MVKKLIIAVENKAHQFDTEFIPVQYNPNRIVINKSGGWTTQEKKEATDSSSESPKTLFFKATPATLDIELFFDTSQQINNPSAMTAATYKELYNIENYRFDSVDDVRNLVNKIFNLANPRSVLNNRPPMCRLIWGGRNEGFSGFMGQPEKYAGTVMFQGFLASVTKTFTRFSAEGVPTRATLGCKFSEHEEEEQALKKLNPIDDPTRIVKQGETLSSIAREEYGNAQLWRVIADANRLTNPRQLKVGSLLTVPPLPHGEGR